MLAFYFHAVLTDSMLPLITIFIKSPPTMWRWRLLVFAEYARRRRILFLLSIENPCLDYLQIFAV